MTKKRELTEHIVAVLAGSVNCLPKSNTGVVDGFVLESKDIILAQRKYLETTEDFRQVLPVAVFTCRGNVWAYKRTKSGNESGLHDQVSVAVGGHWDLEDIMTYIGKESDINVQLSLHIALERELDEEISLNGSVVTSVEDLCTLASSETPVDRKHLALMQRFEVDLPTMESSEDELESMGFMDPSHLLEMHELGEIKLETWGLVACKILANK